MIKIVVKIKDIEDAINLVRKAGRLSSDIDFTNGRVLVDAKSIIGVLSTDFSSPCEIIILDTSSNDGIKKFLESIKENILSVEEQT